MNGKATDMLYAFDLIGTCVFALSGAALLAGAVVILARAAGLPPVMGTTAGAALCFFPPMMAIYWGWRLPVASRMAPTAGRAQAARPDDD